MSLKTDRVVEYPFPKTKPESREGNFSEVQLPYTAEQAMAEADRCVRCGNPVCIDVCPVQTDVRGMCEAVARGDVTIVYRRTEVEMPVDPILIEEGKEEGLKLKLLMAPKCYNGKNGKATSVTMTVMKLGPVDASGRRSPVPTGEEVEMECDSVIVAIGRGPNSFVQKQAGIKTGPKNAITVDDKCQTSLPGVFAAGDVVTGESLVVKAMGKGREAAQRIHEYLLSLDQKHISLYDYYFSRRTSSRAYQNMLDGKEEKVPPV